MGRAGDWVLEGWRFAGSPVSLRGREFRSRQLPFGSGVVVLVARAKALGRPGAKWWNCRWFCGSVGVPLKHC